MMDHCSQSKGSTDLTIPNWTWWTRIFCITSPPTSLTSGQRTDCVSNKQTLLLIGNVVTREETFLREDSDARCRWKWYYFVFLINSWFMSHILVSGRVQKYYTRLYIRQNWNHVTYHAGSHNLSLTLEHTYPISCSLSHHTNSSGFYRKLSLLPRLLYGCE